MKHQVSMEDSALLQALTGGRLPAESFHHREHLQIAYALLVKHNLDQAHNKLKAGLLDFLRNNGVDTAKYHETMTYAWLLAVWHFMHRSAPARSFQEFIAKNPILLDKDIMYSHYSRETIGSAAARTKFVEPDLEPIPLYDDKIA